LIEGKREGYGRAGVLVGFFLIWRFRDIRFRIFDVVLDVLDGDAEMVFLVGFF